MANRQSVTVHDHGWLLKVRTALSYDATTGQFTWLVTQGKAIAGRQAGTSHCKGYIAIRFCGRTMLAHRLAWFFTYDEWPSLQIDHINGVPSDNRISNLRLATHQQNLFNKVEPANNTSGVLGVGWYKANKKWRAYITHSGRQIHLGFYGSKDEAVAARKKAERLYFGDFAPDRSLINR